MRFQTNKTSLITTLSKLRNDGYAFATFVIPKATKTQKQQKAKLTKEFTDTIQEMNTDDFGIRIIILKTLQ